MTAVQLFPTLPAMAKNGRPTTPAEYVVDKFGDGCIRAAARKLDRSPGTVHRWLQPLEEGGTGGALPSKAQQHVMDVARELGIRLDRAKLVPAAP